jgi:small GTP-binding protein
MLHSNLKLILVGETSVGKTALFNRFTTNTYNPMTAPTVGSGAGSPVTLVVNRCEYKFMIWDTAGQERYRSIAEAYYRGVSGCFLVYDVTARATWEAVTTFWLDSVRSKIAEDVPVILVGNKSDLAPEAFHGEAASFAEENECSFAFTSAETGDGVSECLMEMAERVVSASMGVPYESKRQPATVDVVQTEQKRCC